MRTRLLISMVIFFSISLRCFAADAADIFYQYPNSGTSFEALYVIPTNGTACVGDFNEDGSPDIIVMGPNYNDFNRNLVNLLLNNKNGTFTRYILRIPGLNNGSIDYTWIGDKTYLLTMQGGTASTATNTNATAYVAEMKITGNQVTCIKKQNLSKGLINGDLLFVDVDADGYDDIIQFGGDEKVYTYRNDGANKFDLVTDITGLNGARKGMAKIYDLNKDGKKDIISIDEVNGLMVYLNTGNNGFNATQYSTTEFPFNKTPRFELGDFNKDGNIDIVAFDTNTSTSEHSVVIFYGDSNAAFIQDVANNFMGVQAAAVSVGDFNADGKLDILYAGENNKKNKTDQKGALTKKAYILLGDGNKGFTQQIKATPEKQNCDIFSLSPVGNGEYHVADFDGDGKPDVFALGELGIEIPGKNMRRADLFLSSMTYGFGTPVVKPLTERQWVGFPYAQVRLQESCFTKAMQKEMAYLKSLDLNRFFASTLIYNQDDHRYTWYGGWEDGRTGINFAHYLSGLSIGYASTGDQEFLERSKRCVEIMVQGQERMGDGLFSFSEFTTYGFNKMAKDKTIIPNAYDENGHPWGNNDIGFPFYNQHKVFAGLRDAYLYTGNEDARICFLKHADFIASWLQNFDQTNMQLMLESEHGGMVEVLSDAYALSGHQKYLDAALKFTRENFAHTMSNNIDDLSGRHANSHIPMAVGASVHYLYSGDQRSHKVAHNFFHIVHDHHALCNGGASNNERFGTPDLLTYRLGTKGPETCCSYNMLKLSKNLFCLEGDTEYLEYYENALYNHILGSISPNSHAGVCYYTSLKPGTFKMYDNLYGNFWCCVSSSMESHMKYVDAIYFKNDNGLLVNLFTPSTLDWAEEGFKLKMETDYPNTNEILLKIEANATYNKNIHVRYPKWAKPGSVEVLINGTKQNIQAKPGELISLAGEWKTGDEIKITIPCIYHLVDLPDDINVSAIFYGPLMLAANLGATGQNDVGNNDTYQVVSDPTPDLYFPSLKIKRSDLESSIVKTSSKLFFKTKGLARNYNMAPFYDTHHCRYNVYWKLGDDEDLATERALIPDRVIPGLTESENSHNVKSASSNTGMARQPSWFGPSYYWYRDAAPGGFLSYDLTLLAEELPAEKQYHVQLTYFGFEPEGHGNFNIYVDNTKIATVGSIARLAPLDFAQRYYPIPRELTNGKQKITLKISDGRPSIYGVKLTTTGDLIKAIKDNNTTSLFNPTAPAYEINAWINDDCLHIKGQMGNPVKLYTMDGQLIFTNVCYGNEADFKMKLNQGVYIIQVQSDKRLLSKKVIVQ